MCKQMQIKNLKLKPIWIGGHNLGFIIPKKKFKLELDKEYIVDLSEECVYKGDNDATRP